MLLKTEDDRYCTDKDRMAEVTAVNGEAKYQRHRERNWTPLPKKPEEFTKIYFLKGDLVKVHKGSITIKCMSKSREKKINAGETWAPLNDCSKKSKPDE